jgi:anti-sigma regulatory factor (Ser/Thr protein kinase)
VTPHRLSPAERRGLGVFQATVVCDGAGTISLARARVRELAATRLGEARLADALLLTSEVVTNGLLHAGDDPATMWAGIDDRRLLVEVHDSGDGLGAGPGRRPVPDPTRLGGRGLFLVDRLADRWGHRDRPRPVVWFEIDCPDETSGDSPG